MNLITLDFETRWSDDYTLKKMSQESYLRDSRFEVLGCAIKWCMKDPPLGYAQGETWWYDKRHIDGDQNCEMPFCGIFECIDWENTAVLAHHAAFDGFILSHHYGIKPKFWFDTLQIARLLIGNHLSVGLDSLAKQYGLAAKTVPYNAFKGKGWAQLDSHTQQLVADGCKHDVNLTWDLFQILGKQMPVEEFEVCDTVTTMFTNPVLRADVPMLAKIWTDEATKKKDNLAALNVSEADLQSADRFAALLREEGVEPETKQGKNKSIYCFAKTDQFMRDLLENDNDRIRTLAEARLGVKSTLMQTRSETLGFMATRGPGGSSSPLPVYLRYAGAGTLRVSGGDGANWLNFKRGSNIRRAIMAPDGYLLGPVDASQIECRVCHFLAGGIDEPVIQLFKNGEDPYVGLASRFYGETIYKPEKDDPRKYEMEIKRGMGKQGRLMCQYGAAGPKFKITAKNGLYGPPVEISMEDATAFVKLYRETNPSICDRKTGYWAQAERMLGVLARGETEQWGPLLIKDHRIYLPNGCPLIYDSLEWHIPDADEENVRDFERNGFWRLKTRQGWKKMWGAKLTQNICEAVSRVIVSQAMIRIKHMGFRTLNWPYDELCLLIPDDGHAEENLEACRQEMIREPTWLPGIPLDAEASLGVRYSK